MEDSMRLLTRGSCIQPLPELAVAYGAESLLVYAGAASKPPTEEAAKLYEQKTGVKVELVIGGSGSVLSQMKLAKQGDIYFPGSSDYMEKAKREGDVIRGFGEGDCVSGACDQCSERESARHPHFARICATRHPHRHCQSGKRLCWRLRGGDR